jgi:6-pyruvoyltetrahydropterin/6-carboxytetrahydropterin synthase
MWTISKQFSFSSSHYLSQLPDTHPCSRLHGHNYTATFFFCSATLTKEGFVIDYRELSPIKTFIKEELDHRHLNDILLVPTVENISLFLYEKFKTLYPQLHAVEVQETPKTCCRYEPNES